MRYELQFYLCCCKSFLKKSSAQENEEDFYAVLRISRDASTQEVKHAYKQCSLKHHPDKLAQRGLEVTDADRERFNRIKDAHEVLSDPRRREMYDVVGEQGLKWIEEPFSINPTEAYRNFANSSIIDRSKIFLIFVAIFVLLFIVPILVCLQVDGDLGGATWVQILTPIWILDVLLLFHNVHMLVMGPIERPDDVSEEEWIDPLPMSKRRMDLFLFVLKVLFEIMLALKLDDNTGISWGFVFLPIWFHDALSIRKVLPLSLITVMTLVDFGEYLGKPPSEVTDVDRFEAASNGIAVVPSTDSPETLIILKTKSLAKAKLTQIVFRDMFLLLVILQLEDEIDWSWWLVFLPVWIMLCLYCCSSLQELASAQEAASVLYQDEEQGSGSDYGAVDSSAQRNLTDEEKELLQEKLQASGSQFCNTCFNVTFSLLMIILLVAKANGGNVDNHNLRVVIPFVV